MWKILSILAVLGVAIADPAKPELPSQYSVTNIQLHMETNAGYPPHHPAPPTGAHRKTPTSSFRVLSRKPLTCVIYLIKLFMPKPGSEKNFRPATGA